MLAVLSTQSVGKVCSHAGAWEQDNTLPILAPLRVAAKQTDSISQPLSPSPYYFRHGINWLDFV
jgi:hypothetical protein